MTDHIPNPAPEFDPGPYLTTSGTKQIINFRGMLLWLRHAYPDAILVTEQISHQPFDMATFKATVEVPTRDGEGGMVATGYGMALHENGAGYYQAAERIAKMEAIGALGIGTAYLPATDYLTELVPATTPNAPQSPQTPANPPQRPPMPAPPIQRQESAPAQRSGPPPQAGPGPVSEKQIGLIWRLAGELNINSGQMTAMIRDAFNTETVDQLSKADASRLIDHLNDLKRGGGQ